MWRYLLGLAMLMHGAGHILFVANAWGYWKEHGGRAYLFCTILHAGSVVEGAAGMFWLLPLILFVATAQGIISHASWWIGLALKTAVVSIAMLILYWGGLSITSMYAALAFNGALIVGLLWRQHAGVLQP
jgi:hypothetical protein